MTDPRLKIKPFTVTVSGFPLALYFAATRGKAQASAWRDYIHCQDISYGDFLKISRCFRAPAPVGFGEKIMVAGSLAYRVPKYGDGHYVAFVRPDSDTVLLSHHLDVEPYNEAAELAAQRRRAFPPKIITLSTPT